MRRALALLAAVGLILGCMPEPAAAVDQGWRFRPGRICVDYHGWQFWPTVEAISRWDASKLWMVAWWSCSSQPRNMTIVLRIYQDATVAACARTDPGPYLDAGGYVRQMTIWLNTAPQAKAGCYATYAMRAHIISHELGHALGLAHRMGASVMASWAYQWPTSTDIYDLSGLY